jgi:hypothetical protein
MTYADVYDPIFEVLQELQTPDSDTYTLWNTESVQLSKHSWIRETDTEHIATRTTTRHLE